MNMLTWITLVKEAIENLDSQNHEDFSIEKVSVALTSTTLSVACQFCSHFSYVHNMDIRGDSVGYVGKYPTRLIQGS